MGFKPASWQNNSHNLFDDLTICYNSNDTTTECGIVLCVAHNFHERSEFNSVLLLILLSKIQLEMIWHSYSIPNIFGSVLWFLQGQGIMRRI